MSKAQRSKQWHIGLAFWDGLRSSALKGLGLRVTDGAVWVDLLPYDDKLQHSVIQAYGQMSAQLPMQMVISPVWANMGVIAPDSNEKVDNARIESFIRSSAQNFCASRMHPGQDSKVV